MPSCKKRVYPTILAKLSPSICFEIYAKITRYNCIELCLLETVANNQKQGINPRKICNFFSKEVVEQNHEFKLFYARTNKANGKERF